MHAYSAVPDIEPDRKAGVSTIAVRLGAKRTLGFILLNWLVFSGLLIWSQGIVFSLSLIYPVIVLLHFIKPQLKVDRVYWYFPYLNGLLGFLAFWYIVMMRFGTGIWSGW